MNSLIINEIFYSIQGESLNTGQPTIFVRLTGCPLRCLYCDTDYAFNEGNQMSFEEILTRINTYKCNKIMITGGEPLSQKNIFSLMKMLSDNGFSVSIETSNAINISQIDKRVTIILDVKTPGSGEEKRNLSNNYEYLKSSDQIKFVICNQKDYEWSKEYIANYKLFDKCEVLMSPCYETMNVKQLAENILKDSLPARLQIQLHKFIWGEQRGK